MANQKIGAYSPETAKMILEVVDYLKSNGYITTKGDREYNVLPTAREHVFLTAGTITARSGTTAGKGTGVRCFIPGDPDTSSTIEEFNNEPVVLYWLGTCEIAINKYVVAVRECSSGKWIITNDLASSITDVYIESGHFYKKLGCGTPSIVFDITSACP